MAGYRIQAERAVMFALGQLSRSDQAERLFEFRRVAASHQQAMAGLKKAFPGEARFFKQEAAEAMRQQRGIDLLLGAMGFGEDRKVRDWPDEIIPYSLRFAGAVI